jgi:hypothetical protein
LRSGDESFSTKKAGRLGERVSDSLDLRLNGLSLSSDAEPLLMLIRAVAELSLWSEYPLGRGLGFWSGKRQSSLTLRLAQWWQGWRPSHRCLRRLHSVQAVGWRPLRRKRGSWLRFRGVIIRSNWMGLFIWIGSGTPVGV